MRLREQKKPSFEEYGGLGRTRFEVISEERRELFAILQEYSRTRCVAADLDSKRGFAWVFDELFRKYKELISHLPAVGTVLH